ncbi:hypothetical protein [Deinococcus ficus]|uniref:hypothetical protein n=1 Tax=Deinococcus ficus TaxID=317577 RepID=UPI0003B4E235|nr:hypothetical protein [Deinococcus ficus]
MARFDYLEGKRRRRDTGPGADEKLEAVYLRRETVRAVWRQLRRDRAAPGSGRPEESVSELVEDLLVRWLRERERD